MRARDAKACGGASDTTTSVKETLDSPGQVRKAEKEARIRPETALPDAMW